MAQRGNDAASRGAPTELLRAEFVGRMVKRGGEAMQLGIVRKSINAINNPTAVTPAIPSHQSINYDYDDEEELNS